MGVVSAKDAYAAKGIVYVISFSRTKTRNAQVESSWNEKH